MTREEAIKELENMKKFNYTLAPLEVFDMAIKALWAVEHMPTTKNDLGVDYISRQAVLELIADYDLSMGQVVKGIHALPSVTPQEPKTGHWIKISPANIYECSECGQNVMTQDICAYKFCHGCGAKMAETEADNV